MEWRESRSLKYNLHYTAVELRAHCLLTKQRIRNYKESNAYRPNLCLRNQNVLYAKRQHERLLGYQVRNVDLLKGRSIDINQSRMDITQRSQLHLEC